MCNWLVGIMADNLAVAAFVGAVWSFIVEMFPGFVNLGAAAKRWIMLALCVGVPIVALFIAVYGLNCPEAAMNANMVGRAIAAGATAFLASQVAHVRKLE